MYKKFAVASLAALALFYSCKKSDNPTPAPPKTDSTVILSDSAALIGKWKPISQVAYFYALTGGFMNSQKTTFTATDYFDFEKTKIYSYLMDNNSAYYDTVSYSVINSTHSLVTVDPYDNSTDTSKVKISHDTLVLSNIYLDSRDFSNTPANEYDTIVFVKTK